MGNLWRVFIRDVGRLFKTPAALVVAGALLILPSLYTWYNVIGFWNPYENTGALTVAVVNQDAGGSSDLTGELNVGERIVDELEQNHQLDWRFLDYDEAMGDLDAGRCYAVFVIPSNFTANLLTITTGDFVEPKIQYYVNEKLGPVSPKITDTGSTTLDQTVNATFVATVSDVAVRTVNDAMFDSEASLEQASSQSAARIAEARSNLASAMGELGAMAGESDEARTAAGEIGQGLGAASTSLADLKAALGDASALAKSLDQALATFSESAVPVMEQSLSNLADVSSKAHSLANQAGDALDRMEPDLENAMAQIDAAVAQGETLTQNLRALVESLPADAPERPELEAALARLETLNQGLANASSDIKELASQASDAREGLKALASEADAKAQEAYVAAQSGLGALSGAEGGSLRSGVQSVASALDAMAVTVDGACGLLDEVAQGLDGVDGALSLAAQAFRETGGLLGTVDGDLESIGVDVAALGQAHLYEELFGVDGLDAQRISSFMESPTSLVTEQLYPIKVYGAAMAPLFMNLTFWIGAFMLMVIMKLEVDDRGIKGLTLSQRYLGRFLLFCVMVVLQAIICCAGLVFIGIDPVNVAALMVAASAASLAYLSIIYAFSVTLQHIGKGICIILVFAQIPGASGLYPIEMTAPFFQAIYPYLPFTYGIGAMREAICGFYETQYVHDLVVLGLFFVAFLLMGLFLRPRLANVNAMVGDQISKGGLFNGERVEAPTRPYRFSQIVRALSDNKAYHQAMVRRYDRWRRMYPRVVRAMVAVAVAVPIVFTVVITLSPTEKIWVLTAWLLWLVLVFLALVIVENLGYAFERQLRLSDMDAQDINELIVSSAVGERGQDG